ncbi:hypothetical protein HYV98_01415 [Candidatus Azambacteria bacterium]|nr:hypothetical protein [Candidatus Azambacteria bacterium]
MGEEVEVGGLVLELLEELEGQPDAAAELAEGGDALQLLAAAQKLRVFAWPLGPG